MLSQSKGLFPQPFVSGSVTSVPIENAPEQIIFSEFCN